MLGTERASAHLTQPADFGCKSGHLSARLEYVSVSRSHNSSGWCYQQASGPCLLVMLFKLCVLGLTDPVLFGGTVDRCA